MIGDGVQGHSGGLAGGKPENWESLIFGEQADTRLPLSVQTLLRPDVDYEARLAVLHLLPPQLNGREVEGLLYYLGLSGPCDGLVGLQERVLKRETMDLLSGQPAHIERVVQGLVSVYRDGKQDVAVRKYAARCLNILWDRASDDLRGVIQHALPPVRKE